MARVQETVMEQANLVTQMGSDLDTVARTQQHLLDGVSQSMQALTELQSAADGLARGMQESEAAHEKMLLSEQAVAEKLSILQSEQTEHAEAAHAAWKVRLPSPGSQRLVCILGSVLAQLGLSELARGCLKADAAPASPDERPNGSLGRTAS